MAPFSTFKKLGIPGPTPWPFVGNLPQMGKKVISSVRPRANVESKSRRINLK